MTAPLYKVRDTFLAILPKWARKWPGTMYRVVTTLGVCSDARRDAVSAAVEMRFPGSYSYETLDLIGRHRGIIRGPLEPDATYAATLQDWLVIGKRWGGFHLMLERIQALFAPDLPWVEMITNWGGWLRLNADGTFTRGARDWNWDNHPDWDSRFWICVPQTAVLLVPSNVTWDELNLAGNLWDKPPRLWDYEWNIYPDLLEVIEESYRPPHAMCEAICVVTNEVAWASVVPDGTWDVEANRSVAAVYLTGTIHNV
jgi:hypothetical protein